MSGGHSLVGVYGLKTSLKNDFQNILHLSDVSGGGGGGVSESREKETPVE